MKKQLAISNWQLVRSKPGATAKATPTAKATAKPKAFTATDARGAKKLNQKQNLRANTLTRSRGGV